MDNITHAFLGAALAQSLFARPLKKYALIVGAIAANLPDLDVFLRTGDAIRDHALHRYFLHSLLLAPILGLLVALPFAATQRLHPHWRKLCLAGILAALSHGLLDACTSYGTCLLWPFSDTRISWDAIAIVDPLFSLALVIGVLLAARRASPIPARYALLLATLYLSLGLLQHHRATEAQQQLAHLRGHTPARTRAMPLLANIIAYRSLYEYDGSLYADTIRVPLFFPPTIHQGESIPLAPPSSPISTPAQTQQDLQTFAWFADGFVAPTPNHPTVLGDMRYSARSNAFQPFWGIQLNPNTDIATWTSVPLPTQHPLRAILNDILGRDETYLPLTALHP